MSGERPSAPLWPEGLRKKLKLPPVESQRTEALPQGVPAPVAKQPELSKSGEQRPIQPSGVKKAEEPKEQSSEAVKGVPTPMRPAVLQSLPRPRPSHQGNAENSQLTPGEQLEKPPPKEPEEVVETLDPEVEEMIRHAAMGDPAIEANLLESAKNSRVLRDFFKNGPSSLTRSFPAIDLTALFRRERQ